MEKNLKELAEEVISSLKEKGTFDPNGSRIYNEIIEKLEECGYIKVMWGAFIPLYIETTEFFRGAVRCGKI